MEKTPSIHKIRDLLTGFFSWFLVGSLIQMLPNSEYLLLIVSLIVIGVLLYKKELGLHTE